jgi:hypothetical protein
MAARAKGRRRARTLSRARKLAVTSGLSRRTAKLVALACIPLGYLLMAVNNLNGDSGSYSFYLLATSQARQRFCMGPIWGRDGLFVARDLSPKFKLRGRCGRNGLGL